jgi:hypothetical protein
MSKVGNQKKVISKEPPPEAWQGDIEALLKSSASLVQATTNMNDKKSAPEGNICYGRVEKLQNFVPDMWWKTVFADSMYLKTDGDVVEDPDITKEEIKQLSTMIPELLDVFQRGNGKEEAGCGMIGTD